MLQVITKSNLSVNGQTTFIQGKCFTTEEHPAKGTEVRRCHEVDFEQK